MHVRCPHCQNPINLVDGTPLREIECPSCGSSFNLISGESTATFRGVADRTVGHFVLVDQIGVGGFGTVWQARDTKLDRLVALKIPRSDHLNAAETEAFFREARAAAQLRHPNIVAVHEIGRDGETIFIASDYVQGANLKEWISRRRLAVRESAQLCVKLANSLQHAHQAGVIHRDLKPSNIMMDLDGEPHIMDFGLARRESGEITMTMDGQILGTPAYMSPEQARGQGHRADCRTDIYSMGVILYELLTGEIPFRGAKRMLIVQILEDEPPNPRHIDGSVPYDLETICLKSIEKDVDRRYQTAKEFALDLCRWLDGHPIRARPISKPERAWRWCKRNSLVASLILTVVLSLIAGIISSSLFAVLANRSANDAANSALIASQNQQRATAEAKRANRERERVLAFTRDTLRIQLAEELRFALQDAAGELKAIARFQDALLNSNADSVTNADVQFIRASSILYEKQREAIDNRAMDIQWMLRTKLQLPTGPRPSSLIIWRPTRRISGGLSEARAALKDYVKLLTKGSKDAAIDLRSVAIRASSSLLLVTQTLNHANLKDEATNATLREAKDAADAIQESARSLMHNNDKRFTIADVHRVRAVRYLALAYMKRHQRLRATTDIVLLDDTDEDYLTRMAFLEAETALEGYCERLHSNLIDKPGLSQYFHTLTSTGVLILEALELAELSKVRDLEALKRIDEGFALAVSKAKGLVDDRSELVTSGDVSTILAVRNLLKLKQQMSGELLYGSKFFSDAAVITDDLLTENCNRKKLFWSNRLSEAASAREEAQKAVEYYWNQYKKAQVEIDDIEWWFRICASRIMFMRSQVIYHQVIYARTYARAVTESTEAEE